MTGLFEGNVSTLSVKNQVLSLVSFYQKIKQNQKNQDKNQKMKKIIEFYLNGRYLPKSIYRSH
jgi:uncharacterized membrane protein